MNIVFYYLYTLYLVRLPRPLNFQPDRFWSGWSGCGQANLTGLSPYVEREVKGWSGWSGYFYIKNIKHKSNFCAHMYTYVRAYMYKKVGNIEYFVKIQ